MRWLTKYIVFASMLVARSLAAETSVPAVRFCLTPEHITENRLRADHGGLTGVVEGGEQLTDGKPAALVLSGKQHVTLTDDHTTAKLPAKSLTVAAWVRLDAAAEWSGMVSCIQDNGNYERGWLLGYRGTRFCFGLASAKSQRITYLTAPAGAVLGEWYHVVGTYDGEKMALYVDGRAVATSAEQQGDISYPPKTWLELGCYRDDNEIYPLVGQLAEVSWYDVAVSAQEVGELFQSSAKDFPESQSPAVLVKGWPTWQHDYDRTGSTSEELSLPLSPVWIYHARHAPAPAWPAPADQNFWGGIAKIKARVTYDRAMHTVSDGERVYFGSSADDAVRCLDLATGRELWKFVAEGPVRLAPTLADGRVYFGSDDGCAYCLSAADGAQQWKTRVAGSDRCIPGNERMISAWPVRTDLVVADGQVRCAAGLFPTEGTYQAVLDAKTGNVLARGELSFSPQGYLRHDGEQLMVAQGRAPETSLAKLARRGKTTTTALAKIDDHYPLARIGTPSLTFGGGEGKVAAFDNLSGELKWSAEVDGGAWSLAIAGGKLLVSTDQGRIYAFAASGKAEAKPVEIHPPSDKPPAGDQRRATLARQMLSRCGFDQGWCLVLGAAHDAALAAELARQTRLQIVCIDPDAAQVAAAREAIAAAGLATRVAVHKSAYEKLPYARRLFNLIVADPLLLGGETLPLDMAEIRELLRPAGGTAIIHLLSSDDADTRTAQVKQLAAWTARDGQETWQLADDGLVAMHVRAPLPGAGQWTHMYGSPANTAASGDEHVHGALVVQWFGRPGPQEMIDRHHRTVPPLFEGGRLFVPGNNRVICVDAYNGTNLWNVEVPKSRRVGVMRDCGNMAATGDGLYIAASDACLALNAATGETLRRIEVPAVKRDLVGDDARHDWGYLAVVGDALFGSTTRAGASRGDHSRQQINETYYDNVPLVTSTGLFQVDRRSGEPRWQYAAEHGAIINSTITVAEGRMFFVASKNAATLEVKSGRSRLSDLVGPGAELIAFDAESGKVLWRRDVEFSKLEHSLYLCWAEGKLIACGSKNHRADAQQRATVWYDTHAFDAADGKPLWNVTQDNRHGAGSDHGEQDLHPVVVGERVYIEPWAYELHTGKRVEDWNLVRGGHGCGAISASQGACFFRALNPTMCDLETGKLSKVTTVSRPGCWINLIPAGGLLLAPEASSGCTCDFPIQTSMGLAPSSK